MQEEREHELQKKYAMLCEQMEQAFGPPAAAAVQHPPVPGEQIPA